MNQRSDSIQQYPVEEQIDLYLIGMTAIHPPLIELADAVARNGEPAILAILKRLETADKDFVKSNLMLILERMACHHNVDLRANRRVMEALRRAIGAIRYEVPRERALESYQAITTGCDEQKERARRRFSKRVSD